MGGSARWPSASLLGRLRSNTRDAFLLLGTEVRYRASQTMLYQGDTANHVVLLLSGSAKIMVFPEAGVTTLLGVRFRGDLVGEMGTIEQRPRSASVAACEDVTARTIKAADFNGFLTAYPDACIEVSRMIGRRLRWANQRRVDMAAHDAPTRVARVLADIVRAYGEEGDQEWQLRVPLSQDELATLAGVSLRTTQDALRHLQERGIIKRSYRQVVVEDALELRRAAKFPGENPQ